jgi:hypothetical protein
LVACTEILAISPRRAIKLSPELQGKLDTSKSFNFDFLAPSFGLVEAPSSQRSTTIIVIACFAVGSRTSMSTRDPSRNLGTW